VTECSTARWENHLISNSAQSLGVNHLNQVSFEDGWVTNAGNASKGAMRDSTDMVPSVLRYRSNETARNFSSRLPRAPIQKSNSKSARFQLELPTGEPRPPNQAGNFMTECSTARWENHQIFNSPQSLGINHLNQAFFEDGWVTDAGDASKGAMRDSTDVVPPVLRYRSAG
jgi:hypothetical protein